MKLYGERSSDTVTVMILIYDRFTLLRANYKCKFVLHRPNGSSMLNADEENINDIHITF